MTVKYGQREEQTINVYIKIQDTLFWNTEEINIYENQNWMFRRKLHTVLIEINRFNTPTEWKTAHYQNKFYITTQQKIIFYTLS